MNKHLRVHFGIGGRSVPEWRWPAIHRDAMAHLRLFTCAAGRLRKALSSLGERGFGAERIGQISAPTLAHLGRHGAMSEAQGIHLGKDGTGE